MDYPKLAELAGFKTAASANTTWLLVKKKIMAANTSENAEASSSNPKKTGGRKSKADIDAEGADNTGEEEEPKSTKKRSRTTKPADGARKRAKTVSSPVEESDDGLLSRASPFVKKEEGDEAFHAQDNEDDAL